MLIEISIDNMKGSIINNVGKFRVTLMENRQKWDIKKKKKKINMEEPPGKKTVNLF